MREVRRRDVPGTHLQQGTRTRSRGRLGNSAPAAWTPPTPISSQGTGAWACYARQTAGTSSQKSKTDGTVPLTVQRKEKPSQVPVPEHTSSAGRRPTAAKVKETGAPAPRLGHQPATVAIHGLHEGVGSCGRAVVLAVTCGSGTPGAVCGGHTCENDGGRAIGGGIRDRR